LDNKIINPKKILFHDKDTKMLILNQDLDTKLYSLDLENGIITSEWVKFEFFIILLIQFPRRLMDIIISWILIIQ